MAQDEQSGRQQSPRSLRPTWSKHVVALVCSVVGIVVIVDSRRLGAGWTSDGPGAGYFPFLHRR